MEDLNSRLIGSRKDSPVPATDVMGFAHSASVLHGIYSLVHRVVALQPQLRPLGKSPDSGRSPIHYCHDVLA